MRIDIPDVHRCCGCIPLRYGLIVWSYIKLIFYAWPLILATIGVVELYRSLIYDGRAFYTEMVTLPLIVLILLVDMLFTIVFLFGGHMKSLRPMKVFYIYNIVMLCIMMMVFLIVATINMYILGLNLNHSTISVEYNMIHVFTFKSNMVLGLMIVGLEAYFVLMIRSEVRKLSNNCDFRFSNNATEAECVMQNENSAIEDKIKVNEMVDCIY